MAVDVGMLNDRPFFNVAGVGFDAHVARLFNERPRGRRGKLPYVVIGVIGPTRLNYARVIPMVDHTARVVSKIIGGG